MTERIEALRRKDRRAWESVYEDCVDAVYRHASYRRHGDREGAEDVTQEVFIRAIEGIETYRGDERALLGWLRGIGRRVPETFALVLPAGWSIVSSSGPPTRTDEPAGGPKIVYWQDRVPKNTQHSVEVTVKEGATN